MILTGRYNEVMEHVKLTAEARERILRGVRSADMPDRRARIVSITDIKRLSAAAACLIALAAGIFALTKLVRPVDPDDQLPPEVGTYGVSEYETAAQLSEAVGFPVEDISSVLPEAADIVYNDIFGSIAQTDFTLGGYSVCFRKAEGGGDVSGDYNEYSRIERTDISGIPVTLKGGGDSFSLALWEKDGYSYSLQFEPPAPLETIVETVAKLAG